MAPNPRRGEVWLVEFDPTVGSEIRKTRPAAVVGSNAMERLPVRLVVPITGFEEKHLKMVWLVPIEAGQGNGLSKKSTAKPEQLRCVSLERFVRCLGALQPFTMEEIDASLKVVLDLP